MEKKVGLFIKTYSNNTTKNERIDIIEELFISVMNNVDSNIIKILIVDQVQNDWGKHFDALGVKKLEEMNQILDEFRTVFSHN